MFESGNPPILSLHASSLTMSNFNPYKHKLKKFQRWPHSHVSMQAHTLKTFQHWPHSHVMIYMHQFQVDEKVHLIFELLNSI
jgi:hypothetical protein